MYRSEMQKLEGVWTGVERIESEEGSHEAQGRWEFHTVFDGRFLLCDYVQTAPDRPTAVGHGVFRKDESTAALTVSWFRSPCATSASWICWSRRVRWALRTQCSMWRAGLGWSLARLQLARFT